MILVVLLLGVSAKMPKSTPDLHIATHRGTKVTPLVPEKLLLSIKQYTTVVGYSGCSAFLWELALL